ncbi:hypothetical protein [Pontibacillus yanchengensis]|uniref:Uncharacterized protein n=1 Tax=Pontibacillus yanchengensis Y32 TaxID=1385514 RepID=A0A0A2TRZ1_9BACI|nr:hypothetical protein [Pontibacillus yanchengensis]KGP72030.1 hypothetical protein N782_14540 [Pontibacillus yanchengensis Y32]
MRTAWREHKSEILFAGVMFVVAILCIWFGLTDTMFAPFEAYILATLLFVTIPIVLKDIRKPQEDVKDREMRKWEYTREKGKVRYITENTLLYSVPFIAISFFLENEYTIGSFVGNAVAGVLGGILMGAIQWKRSQNEYLNWYYDEHEKGEALD